MSASAPSAPSAAPEAAGSEPRRLRIGEVAELTGTTPRTIRYYEEIGLLGSAGERVQGKHRCYTEADVDRLREVLRLRDLLGLPLEKLARLVEAESARAAIRREYRQTEDRRERRRLLRQSLAHIDTQLELVGDRLAALQQLADELQERRGLLQQRLRENS